MRRGLLTIPILLAVAAPAPAHAEDACGRARAELAADDLVRAAIDAAACADTRVAADVDDAADRAGYSPVTIVTDPDGGTVVVEPAPDRPFAAPARVWLPPGRHTITALVDGQPVAQTVAIARDGDRTAALLDLPGAVGPATAGVVDMGDDGGVELASAAPPPTVLPSLLPDRFRPGLDAPDGWVDRAAPARARRWRLAVGPAGAAAGDRAWGASVVLARALGRDPRWALTPAAGATVLAGDGGATLALRASASVERRIAGRVDVGVGPSVGVTRGDRARDGVSLGVVAELDLLLGEALIVAGRADVTLVSTADTAVTGVAALAGIRW